MFPLNVFGSKAYNLSREHIRSLEERSCKSEVCGTKLKLALARSQNAINDPKILAAVQGAYVAMQVCLGEVLPWNCCGSLHNTCLYGIP